MAESTGLTPTVRMAGAAEASYRLLPFRFLDFDEHRRIVVNDVGEYLLLSRRDFDAFVQRRLAVESEAYRALKSKHFLLDSGVTAALQLLATKYRTKKAFLRGFTKLHMFVVTLRCDHSC